MSYENDSYADSEYDSEEDEYPEFGNDASFELFETVGGDSQAHGALKSYKTNDGSLIYWKDDNTGFTTSVERLVQADGYADGTKKHRLTLFVLKIVLACNSDSKIKRAVFNMSFEDIKKKTEKGGKAGEANAKPEILAWAPFDEMVKSNRVDLKKTEEIRAGVDIGGGGAGLNAMAKADWKSTVEWTQTYWETGHSFPTFGSNQTRTGVRWVLNANPRDAQGLPPKLIVGILLSRQSDEPYLANFNIDITGGVLHELLKGIEKVFRRKPGVTKPYKVTPSKEPIWRATGLSIMKRVNLHNMLELKGNEEGLILRLDDDDDDVKKGENEAVVVAPPISN
ncbi:hypothetical protein ONZ43_g1954 [Nemania bipapillata]|uniref:Uncharacterized protein n=1 Tax=Nemania bipapillata TaxID=110536 RepID=A0ACC2J2M1_9PEZI|nr:hypothetical protein ONZ43_g1954 [Nemania bipapillata]